MSSGHDDVDCRYSLNLILHLIHLIVYTLKSSTSVYLLFDCGTAAAEYVYMVLLRQMLVTV